MEFAKGEITMYDRQKVAELRKELVFFNKLLYDRYLTSGTSGNVSVRVPGEKELYLIKASGVCFGLATEQDFVLIDGNGNVVEGEGRPSKEWRFHVGIMRQRPEVNAVIHGHSSAATAYVTAYKELPVVTAAAEAGLNKVGVVGFATPGSEELAQMVIDAFKDNTLVAAVLDRHGFVTVGPTLHKAYYLADVLEDNARVACLLKQIR